MVGIEESQTSALAWNASTGARGENSFAYPNFCSYKILQKYAKKIENNFGEFIFIQQTFELDFHPRVAY